MSLFNIIGLELKYHTLVATDTKKNTKRIHKTLTIVCTDINSLKYIAINSLSLVIIDPSVHSTIMIILQTIMQVNV